MSSFEFTAPLWLHQGGAWHFVTVPPAVSDEIAELTEGSTRGFGSVRVTAKVGGTSWRTSVFPDAGRGAFVLPVKKAVRLAEGLEVGGDVRLQLDVDPDLIR